MLNRRRQQGLSLFGFVVLFAVIGFVSLVTFTCLPVYLNQMKVAKAINGVATSGARNPTEVRSSLQRYWDIDDIVDLAPREVRVVRRGDRRYLVYDYESRRHLFFNISLVMEFSGDVPMSGAGP